VAPNSGTWPRGARVLRVPAWLVRAGASFHPLHEAKNGYTASLATGLAFLFPKLEIPATLSD
jgi:hypothetical protein